MASAGYLILDLFVKYPFASLYRMNMYHMAFPYQYILLTCIVYAFLATGFSSLFTRQTRLARIGITALIIILTVTISSPLGGMLWHFHDMQAGFWPKWVDTQVVSRGSALGALEWLVDHISINTIQPLWYSHLLLAQ